jgi:hypothetical protein
MYRSFTHPSATSKVGLIMASTSIDFRKLCRRVVIASALALAQCAATASAALLVNPGFDNASPAPGPLPAAGFGAVVGPPFSPGFWGAENASITSGVVAAPNGPVTPLSLKGMIEMRDDGLSVTQAWQVVNVTGMLPPSPKVGLSGWFTVSAQTAGAVGGVRVWAFDNINDWPAPTVTSAINGALDASSATWEQISLAPIAIPSTTQWILAELDYADAPLLARNTNGFVDDVQLTIVPEPGTGLLMLSGCVGLALIRRTISRG